MVSSPPCSGFAAAIGCVAHVARGLATTGAAALAASLLAVAVTLPAAAQFDPRPRLLVTTDIGGDPDDQQSLVRLLAHADAFRIEGLIASARGTPGEVEGPQPQPGQIIGRINAYGQHLNNLQTHNPNFPSAASLLAKVHTGNANRGLQTLLPGNGTDGSNAIINAVDASNEPLHVTIWGGATELAQALTDVQATRTPEQVRDFTNKLRVHSINDQDGYDNAADGTLSWIKSNFPTMFIIDPTPAGAASDDIFRRFDSTYRGMYQNDSTNGSSTPIALVPDEVAALGTQAWVDDNIRLNHGALGALYPSDVNQNPNTDRNTTGLKEGDTPSWFSFFANGLADPDDPTQGNWGGRYQAAGNGTNHYVPAFDDLPDHNHPGQTITDPAAQAKWTVARHRQAYQNEFANRMDWFVTENFNDANHPPTPFAGIPSNPKRQRVATNGSAFLLSDGWFDPDGDTLAYSWWLYEEAGVGEVPQSLRDTLAAATFDSLFLDLAGVESGSELHLILEITDASADLPFTRYERFIVQVGTRVIPEPTAAALAITAAAALARRRA